MKEQAADSPVPGEELTISRVLRPDHDLLVTLEAYDLEAFGATGLRTYDLAVMAQAGGVYLANVGDEMVGSCQLLRVFDEPSFFYVVGVYIRPPWQGRGLGRAFLLGLATEVARIGAAGFLLTVAPSNERAMRLYLSLGFTQEAFIPSFYGEGEDRHILCWRLAGR